MLLCAIWTLEGVAENTIEDLTGGDSRDKFKGVGTLISSSHASFPSYTRLLLMHLPQYCAELSGSIYSIHPLITQDLTGRGQ